MQRRILFATVVTALLLTILTIGGQYIHPATARQTTATSSSITAAQARPTTSPLPTAVVESGFTPPPQVIHQPATELLNATQSELYFAFDQPMNKASVEAALTISPTVAVTLHWLNNTLYLAPQSAFAPGTIYTFTLAETAGTVAGVAIDRSYHWHHRTPDLLDGWIWLNSARLDSPLVVTFGNPVTKTAVTLTPTTAHSTTAAVPISSTWNAAATQLTITPQQPLLPETTYDLHFAQLQFAQLVYNPAMNRMDQGEVTDHLVVTTPPAIFNSGMSMQQSPASPLTIEFAGPLNHTATAVTLQLTPTVTGTTAWVEDTLIFTPDRGYFAPTTQYAVEVTPIYTGTSASLAIGSSHHRLLYTTKFQRWGDFGYGPRLQAINTAGPRTIHYQRQFDSTPGNDAQPPVSFALYQLDNEQLPTLLRQLAPDRWSVPVMPPPIPVAAATEVARWPAASPALSSMNLYDNRYVTTYTTTLPAETPPGLYLLNLETGYVNDQLLVLLSPDLLLVKQDANALTLWLSQLDGTAGDGADVTLYHADGTVIATGETDERGQFIWVDTAAAQVAWATAKREHSLSIVGTSHDWQSPILGITSWSTEAQIPRYASYIYTDRPLYRPGQTVHFKAMIRTDDDGLLQTPPVETPVTLAVRDARNNLVQQYDLRTNALGTINGDFALAEGAMLGEYRIELTAIDNITDAIALDTVATGSGIQTFLVEEYHTPDYDVRVTVTPTVAGPGALVTVTVQSDYFLDMPVRDGLVTLRQYEVVTPEGGPGAVAAQWQNLYIDKTGMLDSTGRWTTTVRVATQPDGSGGYPYGYWYGHHWAIEATVQDQAGQVGTGYALAANHRTVQQATLRPETSTPLPGEPLLFTVHSADYDPSLVGGRLTPQQSMRLNINRVNGNQLLAPSGATGIDILPDSRGTARVAYLPEQAGFYHFQLTNFDNKGYAGNPIETTLLIHDPAAPWTTMPDGHLAVESDRTDYQPGDVAQIRILSSFGEMALLALERGTVRRTQLVPLTPPVTLVDLPLTAEDVPNLFITAHVWTPTQPQPTTEFWQSEPNSRLRSATLELAVTPLNKQLTVNLTPDQVTYAPRATATFTLQVTDETGVPVQAELSLALVDEALFALRADQTQPIFPAFYHPRRYGVLSYDTMNPSRFLGGGRGGGGGGGSLAFIPRQDFPDTALWLPVITTTADGTATVTVPLPDSLTTWRATVKAVTTDTQVGEATTQITTTQPVSIDPLLPPVLTVGDQVLLSARLHNNTALTQTVAVHLYPTAPLTPSAESEMAMGTLVIAADSALTQTVALPPQSTRIVGWQAEATMAGTASLFFAAQTVDNRDAVQVALPLLPHAVPVITSTVGEFTGEFTTRVDFTPDIVTAPASATLGQLQLTLQRSLAGSMTDGLAYLTGYPYGCVEQTMSRALPNVVVGRAFHRLGIGDPALQAELPAMIQAGLQRLYGFQHSDGGWGWWYDDSSDPYQTAWVIFGLTVTKEAGYLVDAQVIERGVDYLQRELGNLDQQSRAFVLYSMAHTPTGAPQSALDALVENQQTLDPFAQAAVALALLNNRRDGVDPEANHVQAMQLIDTLVQRAKRTARGVYWPAAADDGSYQQKMMSSTTRSTALVLSALIAGNPEHPLIPDVVRWLMAQRKATGWGTTNETAFTLLALTDYLVTTQVDGGTTAYQVVLDGRTVATGTIAADAPSTTLKIAATDFPSATGLITVVTEPASRLYYRLVETWYHDDVAASAAGPLALYREYIDPDTRQPLTQSIVGQLVEVQLTIQTAENAAYMLIEDRLPGGLVALNERLASDQYGANRTGPVDILSPELGYNRKEIRDDRVSFFVTEMHAGSWQVRYLARATTAGVFVALPTVAEGMYNPETWGRSHSQPFTVVSVE